MTLPPYQYPPNNSPSDFWKGFATCAALVLVAAVVTWLLLY